jgi:hypothetical protein
MMAVVMMMIVMIVIMIMMLVMMVMVMMVMMVMMVIIMMIGENDNGNDIDGNDDSDSDDNGADNQYMSVCQILYFQAVAPVIDAPFLPGDIWRTQFIDKGFRNGLTEEKLCYQVGKIFVGDDPTNINYVSKYLYSFLP